MTDDDSTRRPEEVTDAQLDEFLTDGNRELLEHLEASVDTSRPLLLVMSCDGQESVQLIGIRIIIRDLVRDLDRALCRVRDLVRALDRKLVLVRALDPASECADALACDLVRDLTLVAVGSARDLAGALARDLSGDLTGARDLACELVGTINDVRDLKRGHDLAEGRDLDRVRDVVRALDYASASANEHAHALVRFLYAQKVDVSGADLSAMEIRNLEVLDGIVWTRQTTWPIGIAGQVEKHSKEIRPDVYQVRLGDVLDPEDLTRV